MVTKDSKYLFLGSEKFKNLIKKEIMRTCLDDNDQYQIINKLDQSDIAYPWPNKSSDLRFINFSKENTSFIEDLALKICNELKTYPIFERTKNEIDQFYQSIYYILSISVDRFFYSKQLELSKKIILAPNIVKKKRPFSTIDINLIDSTDEFNSFMLIKCIKSLSLKNEIKFIEIKSPKFRILEGTSYKPKINTNILNRVTNLKRYINKITKIRKAREKIYLADNCLSFQEYIQYFGRYEFLDFDVAWSRLINEYNNDIGVCKEPFRGQTLDDSSELEMYLKDIINELLPFAFIKANKYIQDIVQKTDGSPILSCTAYFYNDCLNSVLGQRNGRKNYLIDHGGGCFAKTYYFGQFKYSKAICVSPSSIVSDKVHLNKPIYIRAVNPLINLDSLNKFFQYKIDIKRKNLFNKKPIALVVPKVLNYYNRQIVPGPMGYKEQLINFESTTRLIQKLLAKGYFVVLKTSGNFTQMIKESFAIYSNIYNKCYFLENSINLVDAFNLADIVFITYPCTTLAQAIYTKKLAVLATPIDLWLVNKNMYPLINNLIKVGAYINTSENIDFTILEYQEYKALFKTTIVRKYISMIYDLAFSYKQINSTKYISG